MSFVLIGVGAYGGGLVTIPLIQHEIVMKQGWLSFQEMAQLLAIAQMTPGPIAVNAATFVGYTTGGVIGAAVATAAVVLPSQVILILLSSFIDRIRENIHVKKVMQGIQLGVLSLIIFATWSFGSGVIQEWTDLIIAAAASCSLLIFEGKLHPIFVILACGVLGLIIF